MLHPSDSSKIISILGCILGIVLSIFSVYSSYNTTSITNAFVEADMQSIYKLPSSEQSIIKAYVECSSTATVNNLMDTIVPHCVGSAVTVAQFKYSLSSNQGYDVLKAWLKTSRYSSGLVSKCKSPIFIIGDRTERACTALVLNAGLDK